MTPPAAPPAPAKPIPETSKPAGGATPPVGAPVPQTPVQSPPPQDPHPKTDSNTGSKVEPGVVTTPTENPGMNAPGGSGSTAKSTLDPSPVGTADVGTAKVEVAPAGDDPTRIQYRQLSDGEKLQIRLLKEKSLELMNLIKQLGSSRELSLAVTKAEECVMWATKHITRIG